jgi:Tfp pilus assembly protein PilO
MAINLNQDMGSLMKDLLGKNKTSGSVADSAQVPFIEKIAPFRNAIVMLTLISGGTFAYYKMYYLKTQLINQEKATEIARLNDLKTQTVQLEQKIATLKEKLNSSKEEYLQSLAHFGNSEDLGELYQSISVLAEKYDLKVLNIKELPKPLPPPPPLDAKGQPIVQEQPLTQVKEVKVSVELRGAYVQYIRFKEDLAVAEMLLKIDEEAVKVKKDDIGSIYAELTLTTYAIDKKSFQNVIDTGKIDNKENKK